MSPLTKSLIEAFEQPPDDVKLEVLAIIRARRAAAAETQPPDDGGVLPLLAESAWAADWDTAEEDEAWRDL